MDPEPSEILLRLNAADTLLLRRVSEHMGLNRSQVLRTALRHYVLISNWTIGCPGLREEVWESASALNAARKEGKV